jgi:hypothetical protein
MVFRDEIFLLRMDRKEIAAQLGMSYSGLTARLNGFTHFRPEEERALREIIGRAREEQAGESAEGAHGA